MGDVKKAFPDFDSKRLVEWQEKGYIKKLINKWYLFSDTIMTEQLAFRVSNCLHHPSYISMESGLSYYHMIPEGVYSYQAVSTRKTLTYTTPIGAFNYRSLKPALYFGYAVIQAEGMPALLAEPEKALLDFLYLNTHLKSIEDIAALRLNWYEIHQAVKWEKLLHYAKAFDSPVLDKRIKLLKKLLLDAYTP